MRVRASTSARLVVAALSATIVAVAAREALALDQPLAGKRLVVRSGKRDRLVLVTRDRIEAPGTATPDDPSLHGASLEVGNPTTAEWAWFELPAAGWQRMREGAPFRFRDPAPRGTKASVRRLRLRPGKRLRLRARDAGITLDEARQETLAVVLTTGSRRYCAVFAGTIRRDEPGRFSARNAPAPASCPVRSGGPTTTTPSSSSSSSSTTTSTASSSSSTESSTSTSTSSTAPSTAESTTTTAGSSTTATFSSTSSSDTSSSTSSTSSSSTSTETSISSTSTSSSTTSTPTSSTTTSTDYTCGGILFLCGGTCPLGQSCIGVVTCSCQ